MPVTLGELITSCKGRRTYDQLSRDCGGVPTPGRIQQLATKDQNRFPDPDTITGLARGLRVNASAVVDACAASLGIVSEDASPKLARLMPADTAALTDGQVSAVLAVIQTFVDSNNRPEDS